MIPHSRTLKLVLAIGCTLSLLAAAEVSASPSRVIGSAADRFGDAPREGDLVHVKAEYDPRGRAQIKIALADIAETERGDAIVGAFFSKFRRGECLSDVFGTGLAFEPGTHKAKHIFVERANAHTDIGPAQASVHGNVVTISASAADLANRGYDCADFLTVTPTGPEDTAVLDHHTVRLRSR